MTFISGMPKKTICFSIVSHGQGELISGLLKDLNVVCRQFDIDACVVVVLNVVEDESFLSILNGIPLIVIRNDVPKGFGSNHNSAFRAVDAEFFVVLNPDLRIEGLNFDHMLRRLADGSIGCWAPKVVDPHGKLEDSCRRFPTIFRLMKRMIWRRTYPDYKIGTSLLDVDWVGGMFVAFRSEVFDMLGGFDERYFMYMEDVDLCRRIGEIGLRVVYDPITSVVHDARRASRTSFNHFSWHLRSSIRFLFGI